MDMLYVECVPLPVSVANRGFFWDPLLKMTKSRGWRLGGGHYAKFFHVSYLRKKITSQREWKILTSHHGASFQSRRQCAEELQVQFADGSNRPGWRRDLPKGNMRATRLTAFLAKGILRKRGSLGLRKQNHRKL